METFREFVLNYPDLKGLITEEDLEDKELIDDVLAKYMYKIDQYEETDKRKVINKMSCELITLYKNGRDNVLTRFHGLYWKIYSYWTDIRLCVDDVERRHRRYFDGYEIDSVVGDDRDLADLAIEIRHLKIKELPIRNAYHDWMTSNLDPLWNISLFNYTDAQNQWVIMELDSEVLLVHKYYEAIGKEIQ